MNNQLPPIDDFIDDEITEADFKVALTRLHAYLTEAVGANGENITAAVTVSTSGSGNAVTGISANGSAITVTKGSSFVPATRTVNGKVLTSDITLGVSDISGAVSNNFGELGVGVVVIASYSYGGSVATGTSQTVDKTTPVSGSALTICEEGGEGGRSGSTSSGGSITVSVTVSKRTLPGSWRYVGSIRTVSLGSSSWFSTAPMGFYGYWQRVS